MFKQQIKRVQRPGLTLNCQNHSNYCSIKLLRFPLSDLSDTGNDAFEVKLDKLKQQVNHLIGNVPELTPLKKTF